jgi:hypothetical protein
LNKWKESKSRVAKAKNASDNREQKQAWLTAIRQCLVAELNAVIEETQDAGFKTRCQALLARIPDPYWKSDDKLDDKERFEAYRDGGVRDWVHNTLPRMTDNRAVAKLKGIGRRTRTRPRTAPAS